MKSDAFNLNILDSEVLNLDGLTLKDLEVFESDSGGGRPFSIFATNHGPKAAPEFYGKECQRPGRTRIEYAKPRTPSTLSRNTDRFLTNCPPPMQRDG